jgi:hypothetical protein
MKRSLAAFFLCTALGLAVVIVAAVNIYHTRDQVEVTEQVIYGDSQWLEGLSVTGEYTWEDTLYWDISYSLDDVTTAQSSFEICPEGRSYDHSSSSSSTQVVYVDCFSDMGGSGTFAVDYMDFGSYTPVIQDLYSQMKPGESLTKTVNLSDYFEDYPLLFTIFTGNWMADERDFLSMTEEELADGEYLVTQENFDDLHDFFQIPMPEEAYVQITLETDGSGAISSYDIQLISDLDSFYFTGVEGENAIYITIQTSGRNSECDFSQIPGGLGVYRLPYLTQDSVPVLYTEQLETVCSLPENVQVEYLELSDTGSQIFVEGKVDGEAQLWVIGQESGEVRQVIPLSLNSVRAFQIEENDLLFFQDNGVFTLLERQKDLSWQVALTSTIPPDEKMGLESEYGSIILERFLNTQNVLMNWDGSTLALATLGNGYQYDPEASSLTVAVFDENGLQYLGQFDLSLAEQVEYLDSDGFTGQVVMPAGWRYGTATSGFALTRQ